MCMVCPVRASLIASNQTPSKLDAIQSNVPIAPSRKPATPSLEPEEVPRCGNIRRGHAQEVEDISDGNLAPTFLEPQPLGMPTPPPRLLAQFGESGWVNLRPASLHFLRQACWEMDGAWAMGMPTPHSFLLLMAPLSPCFTSWLL